MKPNYKNIVAIVVGVTVLIGFITISSLLNQNKKKVNDPAKMQAEIRATATPLMNDLQKHEKILSDSLKKQRRN